MKMKTLAALGLLALTGCASTENAAMKNMIAYGQLMIVPAAAADVDYLVTMRTSVGIGTDTRRQADRVKTIANILPTCHAPHIVHETSERPEAQMQAELGYYYFMQVHCGK